MQPAGAYTPHHGAAAADAMAVKSSAPLSEANEITAAGAEETPAASGSATCTEPQQPCIEARDAAALLEAAAVLPSRADVLFTDLFDHRSDALSSFHAWSSRTVAARCGTRAPASCCVACCCVASCCIASCARLGDRACANNVPLARFLMKANVCALQRPGVGAAAGCGLCCDAAAGAWRRHGARQGPGEPLTHPTEHVQSRMLARDREGVHQDDRTIDMQARTE